MLTSPHKKIDTVSLVNQPIMWGNTSGNTCTTLRAVRNVVTQNDVTNATAKTSFRYAECTQCSMTVYTLPAVFLQQTRQVHGRIVEHSHSPLLLGRPTKTSRPWTYIFTAVDGALSSQAFVLSRYLTRTPDYNRCSCRYTPGSPPSLHGARYVYTPQESRYSHTRVTSLESCNLIGSNIFLPVA